MIVGLEVLTTSDDIPHAQGTVPKSYASIKSTTKKYSGHPVEAYINWRVIKRIVQAYISKDAKAHTSVVIGSREAIVIRPYNGTCSTTEVVLKAFNVANV